MFPEIRWSKRRRSQTETNNCFFCSIEVFLTLLIGRRKIRSVAPALNPPEPQHGKVLLLCLLIVYLYQSLFVSIDRSYRSTPIRVGVWGCSKVSCSPFLRGQPMPPLA